MSKSKKYFILNKIRNPLYCEILYKINTREVSLYSFQKEFKKARITLVLQFKELEKDGYLLRKREGKKVLFSVNWYKVHIDYLRLVYEESKKAIEKFNLNVSCKVKGV